MESQIETMRGSLAALKNAKQPKEKKKKEKRDKNSTVASSSKNKVPKHSSSKKKSKKPVADDDVLTFDQKKDLSEAIAKLDGVKLEKVIQIIHEGVPEIRDVSLPCTASAISCLIAKISCLIISRAPRKLNWKLTYFHRQSLRSCITSSFDHYGQVSLSGQDPARAQAPVDSSGKVWTRMWKRRKYGSWRRGCDCSRITAPVMRESSPRTIATIRRTLVQQTIVRVVIQNEFIVFVSSDSFCSRYLILIARLRFLSAAVSFISPPFNHTKDNTVAS
jgi:Bromodomain extra-terminal - transcription regulation